VPYRGAAPAEVEEGVVVKIEEAIENIEGIREVQSRAFEGMGQVTVMVMEDYDLGEVIDEIKMAVDGISTFPGETERPMISKQRMRQGAVTVQLSGDINEWTMKELAETIKSEILALPGVTYAELMGARPFEVSVQVSEDTLREYGLTLNTVAEAIRSWSVDLPGGNIRTDAGDIRLRTKGQAYTGREFADIVLLTRSDGTRVLLGDIAEINDGFVETNFYSYFNGNPSIGIRVYSTDAESEVEVARAVKQYVGERQSTLPRGIDLTIWMDITYYMDGRMDMMYKNMAMGALLVFGVLSLFLHLKFALWVTLGLPIAFLGALMLLPLPGIDVSINILSTFGFILVLGIVVDDAIIIAESVYSETERSGYTMENIVSGAKRVAVPATFGVLTTIMAFLPMLAATGPVASMSGAIGWVVVLCLCFSLVESKLILPSHLAIMRSSHGKAALADRVDRVLLTFVENVYKPFLARAINHRYTTLALFIGVLIISIGAVGGGFVRYTFFPEMEDDFLTARMELYEGAPEALVHQVVDHMNGALLEINEELKQVEGADHDIIVNVLTFVVDGKRGQMLVELTREDRDTTPQLIEKMWREKVGNVAGTRELKFVSTRHSGGGPPIAFKLTGRNYSQLEQASVDLVSHLEEIEGVFEVESSYSQGSEELQLKIKPEAEALGITLADLARQVRFAFYGAEAQRMQRGEQEVRVMVRYPLEERRSVGNLENMWIRTPDGREVPFSSVADYTSDQGYNVIQRLNGERAITITARSDAGVIEPAQVVREVRSAYFPQLQSHYPGVTGDVFGSSQEERLALDQMLAGFAVALFGIYALMAIPLRSYLQPLFIMSAIPFGIVGAIVGHMLLDIPISSISIFGFIALSGVVVNDSLIMVDFVNKAVARGTSPTDAAIESGAARFRAILLTSLTTFFGLVPIVSETSLQAQIVIPMATSLAFGILFATFITLVLIPALYLVTDDVKAMVWRWVSPRPA